MQWRWNKYSKYGLIFVLPSFLYFLLVFFYPLILAFWNSLHDISILTRSRDWVGFAKFIKVFTSEGFHHSWKITMFYVIMVVPSIMVLSLLISNIIAGMKKQRAINIFSTIFFLPLVASMVSAGMIWDWILDPTLGIVNNVLGAVGIEHNLKWLRSPESALPAVVIIGVWIRVAFGIIIFTGGLEGIPQDYYEVAEIDGASSVKKFFRITLPLLNPQVIMVLTIELIFAFKAFDQIYVATKGGPAGATKTVMIYLLKDVFHRDYGAASVITVTLLLFLFLISFLQRQFLRKAVEY